MSEVVHVVYTDDGRIRSIGFPPPTAIKGQGKRESGPEDTQDGENYGMFKLPVGIDPRRPDLSKLRVNMDERTLVLDA